MATKQRATTFGAMPYQNIPRVKPTKQRQQSQQTRRLLQVHIYKIETRARSLQSNKATKQQTTESTDPRDTETTIVQCRNTTYRVKVEGNKATSNNLWSNAFSKY